MSVPVTTKLNSRNNPEKKSEIFKSGAFRCKDVAGNNDIGATFQLANAIVIPETL